MKNLLLFKSLTKYCISQYSQFTPEAARPIDRTCCSVSRDAGVVLKTRQSLKRQKPGLDKTIFVPGRTWSINSQQHNKKPKTI